MFWLLVLPIGVVKEAYLRPAAAMLALTLYLLKLCRILEENEYILWNKRHTHIHLFTFSLSIFSPSVLDVKYSRDTEPVWLNLLSHPISLKFILTVLHHNRSAELAKGVVGIIYVDKS